MFWVTCLSETLRLSRVWRNSSLVRRRPSSSIWTALEGRKGGTRSVRRDLREGREEEETDRISASWSATKRFGFVHFVLKLDETVPCLKECEKEDASTKGLEDRQPSFHLELATQIEENGTYLTETL